MPVRSRRSREEYRGRNQEPEYEFKRRDDSSRGFARSRRFGDDPTDDSRTMSYVSSPLHMPFVGTRKTYSPYRAGLTNDLDDSDDENLSYARAQRRGRRNPYIDEDEEEFLVPSFVPRRRNPRVNTYRANPRFTSSQFEEGLEDSEPEPEMQSRRQDGRSDARYGNRRQYEQDHHEYKVESPIDDEFTKEYSQNYRNRKIENDADQVSDEEVEVNRKVGRRYRHAVQDRDDSPIAESNARMRKRIQSNDMLSTDLGYIVPATRRRPDPSEENLDSSMRHMAGYIAKRKEFAVEDDEELQHVRNSGYQYRILGNAYPMVTNAAAEMSMEKEKLNKAPMFDMKLRSHVSWEKMNVKFTCKVRGHPTPTVTWYHNMVPISNSLGQPTRFKMTHQYGVHCLEIYRATLEDSGTYRVSAQNHKGEISSYATLMVRRYDGSRLGRFDPTSGIYMRRGLDFPDVQNLDIPGYPRFLQKLWNTSVVEGAAIILSCKVDGKPTPDVFWTLNGSPLDNKPNHIIIGYEKGVATVTILRTYTDDEGEYCCRAFNSCGASTSKCFLRVCGKDAPPSAPSGITFSDITRNDAVMTWKRPGYLGHFGGAPLDGYLIERAEAGSSVWRPHSSAPFKLTQTPLTGLKEEGIYFFRIRAFSKWGTSPPSLPAGPLILRDIGTARSDEALVDPDTLIPPETDEISVEEEEGSNVPGIPSDVSAELQGEAIVISWKSPDSEDIEADGFVLEYSEIDSEDWKQATNDPIPTADPYPVTGLNSSTTYKFRVFAVNSVGPSEPSETCEMFFSYVRPDTAEEDVIKEKVEEIVQAVITEVGENAEENNCTARSPEPSIKQDIDVVKVYRNKVPCAPTDVKACKVMREYIEVCWMPPFVGDNLSYFVEMSVTASNVWKICNQIPARFTRYSVTSLQQGESYIFRVRAVNEFGTSEFSAPSEVIVAYDSIKPPNWWGGMIKAFRVAVDEYGSPCVSKSTIKVCWDEPTTDGGSSVIGYYLEYRPRGGKFKPANNKVLNQRHFTIGELTEGIEYEFRVCACNIVGSGEFRNLPVAVVAKDPAVPDCPTDLKITGVTDESVSLEWKKPQSMGEGKFVGYIVERCKEGSDIWIPCNITPEEVEGESYLVDGLITGQTYFFRATAVSSIGKSRCSMQSAYVTPGECLDDVLDRQGAMAQRLRELEKKRLEEERLRLEEERKEAFVHGIKECKVALNGKARFECVVKDRSTEVDWFFGNWKETLLAPSSKYDIIASGKSRSLMISNCQASDINLVHCVARYNSCVTSAYLIIDGMVPCVFIKEPENIETDSGSIIRFECELSREDATVKWTKYDEEVENVEGKFSIVAEGTKRYLEIRDVTQFDIGEYTVSGYGGSVKVYLTVDNLKPALFGEEINDEDYTHDAGVAEFQTFVIPSALYEEGELPECIWYHNGERVEEGDEKYEIIRDGNVVTMKILDLNYEDSGAIVCCCAGKEVECDINVEKPPPPPPTPAAIRTMGDRPEDIAINFKQALRPEALTGSMRLFCQVTSIPADLQIVWYYDNKELKIDDRKYRSINDADAGLLCLIVENLCADDGLARYTCELISPLKMFDSKVHYLFQNGDFDVILEQATSLQEEADKEKQAKLDERQKKRNARKGGRLGSKAPTPVPTEPEPVFSADGIMHEVTCEGDIVLYVQGQELDAKKVSWLKNSEVLNNDRFVIMNLPGKLCLTIKTPEADDAGCYTCQIKTNTKSIETSNDLTGKVFKQLLKWSAEMRLAQDSIAHDDHVTDDELEKEVALPDIVIDGEPEASIVKVDETEVNESEVTSSETKEDEK